MSQGMEILNDVVCDCIERLEKLGEKNNDTGNSCLLVFLFSSIIIIPKST